MFRRSVWRLQEAAGGVTPTAVAPAGSVNNGKMPRGRPELLNWFRAGVVLRRPGGYRKNWGHGFESVRQGVPLSDMAMLHCVDNTNVKHLRLIKQVWERGHHTRSAVCVTHRVSVMRFKSGREPMNRQQVQPGTVYWAVMFSRRLFNRRHSGLITQFDRNTGILVNDKFQPVGTRVIRKLSNNTYRVGVENMSRVEELPDDPPPMTAAETKDLEETDISEPAAGRLKGRANVLFMAAQYEEALKVYEHAIARCEAKPMPPPPPPPARPLPPTSAPASDGAAGGSAADQALPPTPPAGPPGVAAEPAGAATDSDKRDYTLQAQLHCNAGAALFKLGRYEEAVHHLSEAIRHDARYGKAYYRRGDCHWIQQQWSSCYADLVKCKEFGVSLDAEHEDRLAEAKKKSDEEMAKMWGQLKDMGNTLLGKFGLSTDNFKFTKDPNTGGYSVNFQQK